MRSLFIENKTRIKKAILIVKSKIKIRISIQKEGVIIKGDELNEFIVSEILRAIDFGFDVHDALLLKNQDFVLGFINVKEHTHRKNLAEVRGRIIGTEGKAKRTIEELTGSVLAVKGNKVGLIVDSEHLDSATQAVISLIQGAKHSNVFAYLEKQNVKLKKINREDLGLRESVKSFNHSSTDVSK